VFLKCPTREVGRRLERVPIRATRTSVGRHVGRVVYDCGTRLHVISAGSDVEPQLSQSDLGHRLVTRTD